MALSSMFWNSLRRLDAAGMPRAAARVANMVCNDRHFSVDADGDRVTSQAQGTLVSPNLSPSRYDYMRDTLSENWFHLYHPGPEDVVLDIGAGIGEEAIVFGRMARHVISVEAHPHTFHCLQKTITASGVGDTVTALQCAIVDHDGEIVIGDFSDHLANGIGASEGVRVPARSIASICHELGVKTVDFMKMNIEGAERVAVLGFGDVDIKNMVVSCHDFLDDPQLKTMTAVRAALEVQGYTIVTRPDHPMPYTRCNLYASRA